jgi:hypothetical protein
MTLASFVDFLLLWPVGPNFVVRLPYGRTRVPLLTFVWVA